MASILTSVCAFDLERPDAYERWRERKLKEHPAQLEDLVVEIGDPKRLTKSEAEAIRDRCRRANMAIYVSQSADDPDRDIPRLLGRQLGLLRLDHHGGADEDAISSLAVQSDAFHQSYIPYTNRAIAWHTDGYYNGPRAQIRGLILHCVRPAEDGGENDLLDHEMLYLLLRDRNPEYVLALMNSQAMTIPANVVDGKELRPERSGPVFSVHSGGQLHMRYTDRTRSIRWRRDTLTQEAVACLKELLQQPSRWHFRGKLASGWGLVSNNPLHTRTGFNDGCRTRLLYRARYYERIADT